MNEEFLFHEVPGDVQDACKKKRKKKNNENKPCSVNRGLNDSLRYTVPSNSFILQ